MAGLSIRALLAVCIWALLGVTSAAVMGSVARADSAVNTSTPMSLPELTRVVQMLKISIRSVPEMSREVQKLQRSIRSLPEMRREMQTLQKSIGSLPEMRRVMQTLQRSIGSLPDLTREVRTLQRTTIRGGATYVRWGRTSCPRVSELVYRGFAAGAAAYYSRGPADYLCVPENVQYSEDNFFYLDDSSKLYFTRYSTNRLHFNNHHYKNVPCAVCRSPTRTTALMIPARTSCYPGFQLEYWGYLMAGYWNVFAASQYVCVDDQPEDIKIGRVNESLNTMTLVEGRCGSLRCPPYVNGRELPCVVCSN